MFPEWTSMLSPWQWLVLALVPPAIVALYFLKLRRQPLEVPSTYLWRKSIEDLHVNSLWQRLRRNLLLWLQLFLLLLIILALLNPTWRGTKFTGSRFVFVIDNSASMTSRDVVGEDDAQRLTRLDATKVRVGAMIDAMKTGDAAMIISFADNAQVVQEFTTNQYQLRRSLEAIQATSRRTSLSDALRLAAGLANPGRTGNPEDDDEAAADARPAELYVLSDFKFPNVSDFSLGNLDPKFEMIGDPTAGNVGIVNFTTRRRHSRPDQIQAFARVENHSDQDVTVTLELFLDDQPGSIDVRQATIPARDEEKPGSNFQQVVFTMDDIESGLLRLTHDYEDALQTDNEAWAVVNVPRQSQVAFVSPGNTAFERALTTKKAEELAKVTFAGPADLQSKQYRQKASQGFFDLIIYDRCQPKEMPQANTLFIDAMPPGDRWQKGAAIQLPQIIDSDRTHPLMQLLELGNVDIFDGVAIKPPSGGIPLIESDGGVIFAIGPRDGFEDAVMGFAFERTDEAGDRFYNTNWPLRRSFPVFIQELLTYLGNSRRAFSTDSVPPGHPYVLHRPAGPEQLAVLMPDGTRADVRRGRQNRYSFTRTDQPGVYQVVENTSAPQRFAVNLFDSLESDIRPVSGKAVKRIGNTDVDVSAQANWEIARHEGWKLLALLGLGVLVIEWYIYNRRVYI